MGATKQGKGSKLMAMADRFGLPLAAYAAAPVSHEVTLAAATLDSRFITEMPQRLIGDRAYDADPLVEAWDEVRVEMMALHRSGCTKPKTQDGRSPAPVPAAVEDRAALGPVWQRPPPGRAQRALRAQ